MTDDERKLLSDLADRIAQTPAPVKDSEAEQLIRTRIGSRPDALYLMTQTVLMQNFALQQAQAQLQQYQQAPGNQVSPGGSFIGQAPRSAPAAPQYVSPQYSAPAPQYAAPSQAPPAPGGSMFGQGSFLRGAAQTAAGVAAGALAFEGIESLFHHGGGYGGGGGGFFGGGGIGGYAPPMEETVVNNNYYDNNAGDDRGGNYGGGQDDYQAADNASNTPDDSQYNDDNSGSFDDGGGYDDNSGGGGGDNFS